MKKIKNKKLKDFLERKEVDLFISILFSMFFSLMLFSHRNKITYFGFIITLFLIYLSYLFSINLIEKIDLRSKEGGRIQSDMINISGIALVAIPYIINYVNESQDKVVLLIGAIFPIISLIFFLISNFTKNKFIFILGLAFLFMFIISILMILFTSLVL